MRESTKLMSKLKINLSKKQESELIDTHKSATDKKEADKIKCILMVHRNQTIKHIEEDLLIDRKTIGRHIKHYNKSGIHGLLEQNYIPYAGKLTDEEINIIKNDLRNGLFQTAKAICDHVEKYFGRKFKPESMVKLLKRIGFSYKKTKHVPSKADKEKQKAFVNQYEKLSEALKDDEKIYFMDACHPQHNSMTAYAWIETGTEKEIKSNTGRQRVNINGLYSPMDQEIIYRKDESINAQSTIELLKQLEQKHPELKTIYIIRDNARYYASVLVKEYLEKSKIKMMPLPSYSPNLNLIERLWKYLKKNICYNQYYEKYSDFKSKIDDFLEKRVLDSRDELASFIGNKFHIVDTS